MSLGAGNDTLTLATGTTAADVTANLSGGDGTDTLRMDAGDAVGLAGASAFVSKISGFETLSLTGATGTQAVDVGSLGIASDVRVTSGAGTLTLNGFANAGKLTLATGGSAVVLVNSGWATGTADSVNIATSTTTANGTFGSVSFSGVESATLAATHSSATTLGAPIAAGTYSHSITVSDTTAVADKLTSLVVTGNANVVLTVSGNDVLTSIDGSATTGGLQVTAASTAAATIKGGSGNDQLTAHGTVADVLIGGAGNDTLTSAAGNVTLTGGAGSDTFVVATNTANSNTYTTITDFSVGDKLTVKDASGTESFVAAKVTLSGTAVFSEYVEAAASSTTAGTDAVVKWFQFGGDTYLVYDNNNSATYNAATDYVVKLTGTIDLSNLSLNGQTLTLFA
jgi:S-layer protein